MRKITYNSQRDNIDFAGTFPGWAQCFSTSAWMFLSYYDPGIRADDDKGLAAYVDDVEASVGAVGIAERVMPKFPWIKGRTSLWWPIQREAIQAHMPDYNVLFNEHFPIEQLIDVIDRGPVIIGTNKMGGLRGGHIILLVDYDRDRRSFMVNDPYGDARGNYRYSDGAGVLYPYEWLLQYIDYGDARARTIYAV